MVGDDWLRQHAYLRPVAELSVQVDAAAAQIEPFSAPLPDWSAYRSEFLEGVPLLASLEVAVDLEPAARAIQHLVERVAAGDLPPDVALQAHQLREQLARDASAPRRAVDWLLGEPGFEPASPGLLRYLGWTALARYLQPLLRAFDAWRDEEHWQRRYCPTCGSAPAMAQLLGLDSVRKRLLSCGCCRTRWQFNRTRCPFCEDDSQRMGVVGVVGEVLRIDYCEACSGYLKTYAGQGQESLLLADWSSLHLDLLAQDRGLKRVAASLFEVGG
jgi:FdhE protein